MNIAYTTFGLGIAVGLFISWVWDVIRLRKNQTSPQKIEVAVGHNVEPVDVPSGVVQGSYVEQKIVNSTVVDSSPSVSDEAKIPAACDVSAPDVSSTSIVLCVNGVVTRTVLEDDMPSIFEQWSIPVPSAASEALLNGQPVLAGPATLQLMYA